MKSAEVTAVPFPKSLRANKYVESMSRILSVAISIFSIKAMTITSKVPVKITGASSHLAADSMSFDLNTNRTLLEGNVEGFFSENIIL